MMEDNKALLETIKQLQEKVAHLEEKVTYLWKKEAARDPPTKERAGSIASNFSPFGLRIPNLVVRTSEPQAREDITIPIVDQRRESLGSVVCDVSITLANLRGYIADACGIASDAFGYIGSVLSPSVSSRSFR